MRDLFDLDDDVDQPELTADGRRPRRPLLMAAISVLLLAGAGAGGAGWSWWSQRPAAVSVQSALSLSVYGTPQPVAAGPVSQAEIVEAGYGQAPPSLLPRVQALKIAPPPQLDQQPAAQIAGALPAGFRYQYNDSYHGWPVAPLHRPHTVRGGFLDPRDLGGGYHFGVDVSVDDMAKERGAPWAATHRVYALESGTVAVSSDGSGMTGPCDGRHFALGHFEYWHIKMTVALGQQVEAGQPIGWTCFGEWHVHVSEWQLLSGARIWVNPLHPGGKLSPYVDRASPLIGRFGFYRPDTSVWCPQRNLTDADGAAKLSRYQLSGEVELRVAALDRISLPVHGFLTHRLQGVTSPYRLAVTVRRASDRSLVFASNSYEADRIPQTPYLVHYAPGTKKNVPMMVCYRHSTIDCSGRYLLRPFSGETQRYWDTRQVANGSYLVSVYAWDIKGHMAQRTEKAVVDNPVAESGLGASPIAASTLPACWQNGAYSAWKSVPGAAGA